MLESTRLVNEPIKRALIKELPYNRLINPQFPIMQDLMIGPYKFDPL